MAVEGGHIDFMFLGLLLPNCWICYLGQDLFNLSPDHASVIYQIQNILAVVEYLKMYQEMRCPDSRM